MHPNFKPIHVCKNIWDSPHMKTPMQLKQISAKDSWYPSIKETRDDEQDYISGEVEVRLWPDAKYTKYQNLVHVEAWGWRISIWGNDDTGMELYISSKEDAQKIYDTLDECPRKNSLELWGFRYC